MILNQLLATGIAETLLKTLNLYRLLWPELEALSRSSLRGQHQKTEAFERQKPLTH